MKIELNNDIRIKNMACLYHAITSSLLEAEQLGVFDVFIGYDGRVTICNSTYDYCIVVNRKGNMVSMDGPYDPAQYGLVIYDDDCFYKLSLLETCRLLLDVKDEFDV